MYMCILNGKLLSCCVYIQHMLKHPIIPPDTETVEMDIIQTIQAIGGDCPEGMYKDLLLKYFRSCTRHKYFKLIRTYYLWYAILKQVYMFVCGKLTYNFSALY